MLKPTDKRLRAQTFRIRLSEAMAQRGMSQSDLARAIEVDRSTVSQLLSGNGARLPNAQVAAECAAALGLSADWLLGLSDRPETAADLLATSLAMTAAERALIDEQVFAWHREAQGTKIRHVPATLPDMLKTPKMLDWEYAPHLARTGAEVRALASERLEWLRGAHSDYEMAMPLHELVALSRSEGYYSGLPPEIARAQLARFTELHAQLYPRLRLYLFDARRTFSAPLTIFGTKLAAVYMGSSYLAFRDTARVQAFSRHFDGLVREAAISARDFPAHIVSLQTD
jgi:transcriptional regulator with XRE-family HTH domain